MSNIVYVRSGMNPDLVLGAYDGEVVLQWIDLSNKAQQWIREDHDQNFKLINVDTQTGLAASAASELAGLIVRDSGDLWTAGADSPQGIQYVPNRLLNVNIPRSIPDLGTRAMLWSWSGGAPNETWWITNIADISPFKTETMMIFGGAGGPTALQWENNNFIVNPQGIPCEDPKFLFTITTYTTGVAIQNQYSSSYVTYTGDNKVVSASSQMNIYALWTLGHVDYDNYGVIRLWMNPDMNLNIFGEDDPESGSQVGAWTSAGGRHNELWIIRPPTLGPHSAMAAAAERE